MTIREFLKYEPYAFTIAKVAVVFQSVVTIGIISALLLENIAILCLFVIIDVVFILFHISYRALYRGTKPVLLRTEKILLLGHVFVSMLALGITMYLLSYSLQTNSYYYFYIIVLWILSLILGIMFFNKKYRKALQ